MLPASRGKYREDKKKKDKISRKREDGAERDDNVSKWDEEENGNA